ncbi:MAG: aminodeoxychorismate synthase component I [Candidatus Omnitrophota bacterium]|nr:aminodeoxychorismate synthase component I [Candidatus Omnitrophota bacterium]
MNILDKLKKHSVFVLLETAKINKNNFFSYLFVKPCDIVQSHSLNNIKTCFERINFYLDKGYYAAGFCSYEMGYGFEQFSKRKINYAFPLIWMGIFKKPVVFDHRKNAFVDNKGFFLSNVKETKASYHIKNLRLNVKKDSYLNSIKKIKELIRAGDTYQVNYTMKYKFDFTGSAYKLYYDLRNNQTVFYSAFIKTKDFKVLSFSPELFFKKKGRKMEVRPMKGTINRGSNLREDKKNSSVLKYDKKNRAENIMIVDLLRNDLGRVSETGSVSVPDKFSIEKYETLFQMTSTIKSTLKEKMSLYSIFSGIFPSGSVTGAPKIRTMRIIKDIEKKDRKVYTGSIGFINPNRDAVFNVAIRSILLENKKGEMGVGSGIVYSSNAPAEYEECKLKANFLTGIKKEFQLIETMLWSKKTGFFLPKYHLERLKKSALYFGFKYNGKLIKDLLERKRKFFDIRYRYRVRLLLSKNGDIFISYRKIKRKINSKINLITISNQRTVSNDVFLRHKTTNRKLYDREYKKYKKLGYFDVIFQNERDEITEGAVSNVFIKSNGIYYTPPLKSGLLNGVYRRYFFARNSGLICEKVLAMNDLETADGIFLANSVRGMMRVTLDE